MQFLDEIAIAIENRLGQIEKDPVLLLAAIREHSLNYDSTKYRMKIILDALKSLVNLRQNHGWRRPQSLPTEAQGGQESVPISCRKRFHFRIAYMKRPRVLRGLQENERGLPSKGHGCS